VKAAAVVSRLAPLAQRVGGIGLRALGGRLSVRDFEPHVRDGVAEALLAVGATSPRARARSALSVLTFHRVLPAQRQRDYPLPGLVITPEQLETVLRLVVEHYVCLPVVNAHELWRAGTSLPKPVLALSFDDGARDNFEHARPVLDKLGLRATFYVPAGSIAHQTPPWHDRLGFALLGTLARLRSLPAADVDGWLAPFGARAQDFAAVLPSEARRLCERAVEKAKALPEILEHVTRLETALGGPLVPEWAGLMSWEQLRELVAGGHEVGCHSLTHPLLTGCTDDQLRAEVVESKALLERSLGTRVHSFCYPNGTYDERVLNAVERAGYSCAVTTRWGINTPGVRAFELKRCDVDYQRLLDRRGQFSQARFLYRLNGYRPAWLQARGLSFGQSDEIQNFQTL
jgi:peptidoglycan/xylan/chitin deacetylase (PgdA/CDA1 family)